MVKLQHNWRIKKDYFKDLYGSVKDIEVRVGYVPVKKVRVGDFISFQNYRKNKFRVERIVVYKTFEDLLDNESVERVLPGHSRQAALDILHEIYPPEKEKLGVYALQLTPIKDEKIQFLHASELAKTNSKVFGRLVGDAYAITSWICEDYPLHFEHFWTKYVPGVLNGEREIIGLVVDGKMAGTVILKKTPEECKLCTLYVKDEYRGRGFATQLLERSFDWLGTTKPLATLADFKLPQFEKIIEKYDWELTQTIKGKYNDHSSELVYNGKL